MWYRSRYLGELEKGPGSYGVIALRNLETGKKSWIALETNWGERYLRLVGDMVGKQ